MDSAETERLNDNKEYGEWPTHSAKLRATLQIPVDFAEWTGKSNISGMMGARQLDVLDTAFVAALQSHQQAKAYHNRGRGTGGRGKGRKRKFDLPDLLPASASDQVSPVNKDLVAEDLFAHVDQAVQRKPWKKGSCGCLLQKTEIYSFGLDIMLPAITHCRLQGFPDYLNWSFADTDESRDRAMRSLSGESVSYQVCAIALYAAYLSEGAPWLQEAQIEEKSSESD